MPAMVFEGGEFQQRPPLDGEEQYLFPDPIGWSTAHLSLHSEVATIPLSFADKGIKECSFKITAFGYSEAAIGKLKFLAELGLADIDNKFITQRQNRIDRFHDGIIKLNGIARNGKAAYFHNKSHLATGSPRRQLNIEPNLFGGLGDLVIW